MITVRIDGLQTTYNQLCDPTQGGCGSRLFKHNFELCHLCTEEVQLCRPCKFRHDKKYHGRVRV